jgi:DNA-directed RNA polymerase specialized sigma subunit
MTSTYTLEDLYRTFERKMLGRYSDHHECDDAIQEGRIRIWRDFEKGEITDFTHLINRGMQWARAYMFSDHHPPVGHPGRERDGINTRAGDAVREKITGYIKDFVVLHDREPKNHEIAKALGITQHAVGHHKKVLKEQNFLVQMRVNKDGSRNVDRKAYVISSLDKPNTAGYPEDARDHYSRDKSLAQESFEHDWISTDAFYSLIEGFDEDTRAMLIMTHDYGYSQKPIADHLNVSQMQVSRRLRKVHKEIAEALNEQ